MDYDLQKKKLKKVLERPILTSKLAGLILFKTNNVYWRTLNRVYSFLNLLVVSVMLCQLCSDLIDKDTKDITKFIEILLNAGVHAAAISVGLLYRFRVTQLKQMLNFAYEYFRFHSQFSEDDFVSMEPVMDQVNKFLPILIALTYASSYQWLVLPIFFSGPDGNRLLPVEANYPYPAHETPYYELTFLLHVYSFTCLSFVYSNITCTYTTLTTMICTQFDILCCNIRNSANGDVSPRDITIPSFNNIQNGVSLEFTSHASGSKKLDPEVLERNALLAIADCVEYHQKLREFCARMEDYFNLPFCVQLVMIILTMGLAVISFMERFAMNTAQFTAISVVFISILCFQGQRLLHKSGNVHEAVWASAWQERGPRVRRAYVILMQQGLRPRRLTVGYGLFQLTLDNLIAILKTTFSFFTLLSNMIDLSQ